MVALIGLGLFAGALLLLIVLAFFKFFIVPLLFALLPVWFLWLITRSWRVVVPAGLLAGAVYWTFCFQHVPVSAWLDRKAQSPMQEITEKVEFPESVFIQNDCWKGEEIHWSGHSLYISALLDWTHLKALAMTPKRTFNKETRKTEYKTALYRIDEAWLAETARLQGELANKRKLVARLKERLKSAETQPGDEAGTEALKEWMAELAREADRLNEELRHWPERIEEEAPTFDSPDQLPPMRYRVHYTVRETRWRERWPLYRTYEAHIYNNETGKCIGWARKYRPYSRIEAFRNKEHRNGFIDGPGVEPQRFVREALFGYAERWRGYRLFALPADRDSSPRH